MMDPNATLQTLLDSLAELTRLPQEHAIGQCYVPITEDDTPCPRCDAYYTVQDMIDHLRGWFGKEGFAPRVVKLGDNLNGQRAHTYAVGGRT